MNETDSDDSLLYLWPGGWPDRKVVDLDDLGDPVAWIDEHIPFVAEMLFDDPSGDLRMAESLADDYINAMVDRGVPLPSDFDATEEETRTAVIEDFVGFIREWRRRALAERQKGT